MQRSVIEMKTDQKKSDFSLVVDGDDRWPEKLEHYINFLLPDQVLCIDCINSAQGGMVMARLTLMMQATYHRRPVWFELSREGNSLLVRCHLRMRPLPLIKRELYRYS
jgi:hypothetical protein